MSKFLSNLFDTDLSNDGLSSGKRTILGLQHAFTMFGATVLVPLSTGMSVSVALFMVGIGTIIFHLLTKGKVPAFMGSSFAFITPVVIAAERYGMAYAQGGLVVAGILYILFSILIYFVGADKIMKLFPPVVTGPIIMVIGLTLAPSALKMASTHWGLALVSFAIVVILNVYGKGFIQVLPVLIGLVGGYLISILTKNVDFAPVASAAWIGLPQFTVAKFSIGAILTVAPAVLVTMIEHIGDVVAIGATVKRDFIKNPGLHRTMLADGVAIVTSTMFGGPANTTYSENTGVLALTKVHNPVVMRIAACFAILLSIVPKFGAIISSIPPAVIGGISIILFGMISSIGARTLVENKVNFQQSRNLIVAAVILVLGLGGISVPVDFASVSLTINEINILSWLNPISFEVSGMALAALAGILLNAILPKAKEEPEKTVAEKT